MERPSTGEIRSAIVAFRAVVESGTGEDFTTLIATTTKLLELAARMKGEEPSDDTSDFPDRNAPEDFAIVHAGFPSLSAAQNADDREAAAEWTLIPWDDLCDVYHDIRTVEGLLEGGQEADARWQFRFGFENHWGEHALRLIGYLLRSYRY